MNIVELEHPTVANRPVEEAAQKKKRRWVFLGMAGFLLGIYLFFSFLFSDMGLVNYLRLGQTARNLEAEIAALKKENDRLRDEVEDLKTDPQTIEHLARERLGMAREGDTVFQFEKTPPSR